MLCSGHHGMDCIRSAKKIADFSGEKRESASKTFSAASHGFLQNCSLQAKTAKRGRNVLLMVNAAQRPAMVPVLDEAQCHAGLLLFLNCKHFEHFNIKTNATLMKTLLLDIKIKSQLYLAKGWCPVNHFMLYI